MTHPDKGTKSGGLEEGDFPAGGNEQVAALDPASVIAEPCGETAAAAVQSIDRETIIEATITGKLAGFFDHKTLSYLAHCAGQRKHAILIDFGDELVDQGERFTYFATMCQIIPDGITYARKLAQAAYLSDQETALQGILVKMQVRKTWQECRYEYVDMVLYPPSEKPRTNAKIITACALLEEDLTDPDDMASYAYLAFKLSDYRRLQAAMKLVGQNLKNDRCLTTFSFISRKTHNQGGMQQAFELMEERLDNKYALIEYAVLARIKRNVAAMEIAVGLLAELIEDEKCLNIFSVLVSELGLTPQTENIIPVLERHLDNPYVLTTYASIATKKGDRERMKAAAERMKAKASDGYAAHMFGVLALELRDPELAREAMIAVQPFMNDQACEGIHLRLSTFLEQREKE